MAASRKKFKTEVQQLLQIVIHSLYTKKEIFLRELISNASDACDRARFEALQDKGLLGGDSDFQIRITRDEEGKSLTISDNGVGMTREEVEKNLGTIASSGTRRFMDEMKENGGEGNVDLIGQFGVGFYAAFMVADKVTVQTRRAGAPAEEGVIWKSDGDGKYSVDTVTKEGRGTDVTLYLRDDCAEYLEEFRIRKVVKQYSDFVGYPIVMQVVKQEVPEHDSEEGEAPEAVDVIKDETLNSQKALWKRSKSDITEEEYQEFYRHISHDYGSPLETIHFKAEGTTEFQSLLFLPERPPMDMMMRDEQKGLQLYVRNVFITDDAKEILPEYLRFVRGVVDSADLPLNVSRETLQDDRIIQAIRKGLVSKVLGALKSMKEKEPEKFLTFWKEFGKVLKEGLHFDFANRDKLLELIQFESSMTEAGVFASLKDYVGRMPEGQKDIYYLTGENRDIVENSPYLEAFKSRSYEVLFMIDPIDEWVVQAVNEYDGKSLVAADKGDLELETEDEKKDKEAERDKQKDELKDLLAFMQEKLEEEVKEVRISNRLTDSACCLVADPNAMSAHMERMMQAMNREFSATKRILEINPGHPVVGVLQALYTADKENPKLVDYVELLHDQALLNEGSPIKNPLKFTRRVSDLMAAAK